MFEGPTLRPSTADEVDFPKSFRDGGLAVLGFAGEGALGGGGFRVTWWTGWEGFEGFTW